MQLRSIEKKLTFTEIIEPPAGLNELKRTKTNIKQDFIFLKKNHFSIKNQISFIFLN